MTRAEEAALRAYPEEITVAYGPLPGASGPCEFDDNRTYRVGFIKGYEQAEKETIEMAIAWLESNVWEYTGLDHIELSNAFRKVMED